MDLKVKGNVGGLKSRDQLGKRCIASSIYVSRAAADAAFVWSQVSGGDHMALQQPCE